MQQRAISEMQIQIIEMFGDSLYQKGGAEMLYISRKTLDKLRSAIDKLENVTLIAGDAGKIITVMHRTKKIRSTQFAL
jgi:hypothetical protein